jgi:hypothetical protein
MMFKFAIGRPDSETMREIAESANVSWNYDAILYDGQCIGYTDAPDDADPTTIQDAAEGVVGVRPTVQ